jgi:hypothetical protein
LPKLFRIGQYAIFFWSKENEEPVHVHIAIVDPSPNATKVWLTKKGGCIVAHNKSRISERDLNRLLEYIQSEFYVICNEWKDYFGYLKFHC